jgi:NitT/TauT family transport system substrate-binding protein
MATLDVRSGKTRALVTEATDPPWNKEYCCMMLVNATLIKKDPKTAIGITRAILNGADWVRSHPEEAAKIEVDKNYIPNKDVKLNAELIRSYNFTPAVELAYQGVLHSAIQCKAAGILDDSTDPQKLADSVFLRLPGIGYP